MCKLLLTSQPSDMPQAWYEFCRITFVGYTRIVLYATLVLANYYVIILPAL